LDEFHFSVVAFGDAVVGTEPPHPHDFLAPGFESLTQGFHGLESTVLELLKQAQQLVDWFFAGLFVERLEFEQGSQAQLPLIEFFDERMIFKELFEPLLVPVGEVLRIATQGLE